MTFSYKSIRVYNENGILVTKNDEEMLIILYYDEGPCGEEWLSVYGPMDRKYAETICKIIPNDNIQKTWDNFRSLMSGWISDDSGDMYGTNISFFNVKNYNEMKCALFKSKYYTLDYEHIITEFLEIEPYVLIDDDEYSDCESN